MSNLGVPEERPVYLGVWTNWSHGKVLGSTLTLSQQNGGFLVAFLALFVTFVGTGFFRITSFILHHWLSAATDADGMDTIYHQRQVVLRNSATAADSLWNFSQLFWFWRRRGNRPVRRLLPVIIHAIICIAAFGAAGVFSSRITALTGEEVLISSPHCGLLQGATEDFNAEDYINDFEAYIAQRVNAFTNYVQDCYSSQGVSTQSCKSFIKARLPYTKSRNAGCPFEDEICRESNTSIKLDTGFLDSHSDLGLNAPSSSRIKIRASWHCAPITTQNYTQDFVYSNESFALPYRGYYYGPTLGVNATPYVNYTFAHPNMAKFFDMESTSTNHITTGYGVGSQSVFKGLLTDGRFQPIEPLQHNDSDIHLIFLAADGITYSGPVDDPWFSAHKPVGSQSVVVDGTTTDNTNQLYLPDEVASPLGCTGQYQFCLPSSSSSEGNCSPVSGIYDPAIASIGDEAASTLFQWIIASVQNLDNIVTTMGASFLQAKYSAAAGQQRALPSDQWETEIERLFDIMLASFQGSIVDAATGPSEKNMQKFHVGPQNEYEKYFCKNQKIRSTEYTNFSVFGLALTFALGSVIILINWTLEWIYAAYITRHRPRKQLAKAEWTLNGTFQLQRMAHESVGYGEWTHCGDDVPITNRNDKLATLDLSDPKHPRLQAKATEISNLTKQDWSAPQDPWHATDAKLPRHMHDDDDTIRQASDVSSVKEIRREDISPV